MNFIGQYVIFEFVLKHHNGVKSEWAADKSVHESDVFSKNVIIF